ncbi:MAG: PIG-L family deacetylase [Desulfobulbaceae bacterium]|nr:PIG-L family deacetylase [Desulfobulbaceae bacterium]
MNSEVFQGKRVLIVAAHPDDEALGLGGTVHRLVSRHNCEARAVILGEGITSRGEVRDKWSNELARHQENINSAVKCIGYSSVGIYDFPDNRFDSVDLLDIIKQVESEINEFLPDVIFTHHHGDLNVDHRLTCESVMTATRPLPGTPPRVILSFETPSSTEWQLPDSNKAFLPHLFVPLSDDDLAAKQRAIESYEFECRDYPHPRSIRALEVIARRWGTVIGVEFAEAFGVMRWVLDNKI